MVHQKFYAYFLFYFLIICGVIHAEEDTYKKRPQHTSSIINEHYIHPRTKYNFVVYMSAANDLWPFADRNIEQMKRIGSNEHLNILVHLDIHRPGSKKTTKKLFIQKNKIIQIGQSTALDSGDENTLINTMTWIEDHFPADHMILVFWNHGSGDINPLKWKTVDPSTFFTYNSQNKLIELDRSTSFFETLDAGSLYERGVCFDETTGNYLNDKKLKRALTEICAHRKKKIDLIYFDACLMAGMGTVWLVHFFADYMTASEELVLGTGADYSKILPPLRDGIITPEELSKHIVRCYEKTYAHITHDYTQSAFNLNKFTALSHNVDTLAQLFIHALKNQKNNSIKKFIKDSKSKFVCTHFGDNQPTYIDLCHFYKNMLSKISTLELQDLNETSILKQDLKTLLEEGLSIVSTVIIANAVGKNLKNAGGIYIYFPEKSIHPSFASTEFAENNHWSTFLIEYINS